MISLYEICGWQKMTEDNWQKRIYITADSYITILKRNSSAKLWWLRRRSGSNSTYIHSYIYTKVQWATCWYFHETILEVVQSNLVITNCWGLDKLLRCKDWGFYVIIVFVITRFDCICTWLNAAFMPIRLFLAPLLSTLASPLIVLNANRWATYIHISKNNQQQTVKNTKNDIDGAYVLSFTHSYRRRSVQQLS
jgi:hypothetical protein